MSDYLKQLEAHDDLEAEVIKKTKVHKVLKAIMKLDTIPKEEDYNFKKRSNDLLGKWSGALASENDAAHTAPSAEPAVNGTKSEEEDNKSESIKKDASEEKAEDEEKNKDASSDAAAVTKLANDLGDVAMSEADKEVIKDAPAVTAEAASSEAVKPESDSATSNATAA